MWFATLTTPARQAVRSASGFSDQGTDVAGTRDLAAIGGNGDMLRIDFGAAPLICHSATLPFDIAIHSRVSVPFDRMITKRAELLWRRRARYCASRVEALTPVIFVCAPCRAADPKANEAARKLGPTRRR